MLPRSFLEHGNAHVKRSRSLPPCWRISDSSLRYSRPDTPNLERPHLHKTNFRMNILSAFVSSSSLDHSSCSDSTLSLASQTQKRLSPWNPSQTLPFQNSIASETSIIVCSFPMNSSYETDANQAVFGSSVVHGVCFSNRRKRQVCQFSTIRQVEVC